MDFRLFLRWGGVSKRNLSAAGLALTLGLWPMPLLGAPSEAEKEPARHLMEPGDEHYEAGRYEQALASYQQADALMGVPTTGLAVAHALDKLGRLRQARKIALRVALSQPGEGEPSVLTEARNESASLAHELAKAIPTLQIVVTGPTSVTLVVDGGAPIAGLSEPISLDPGPHEYRIMAEGYRTIQRRVTLERGERRKVEHQLGQVVQPPPPKAQKNSSIPLVTYIGLGVGAAGLVAGSTTGILSLSKASKAKQYCEGVHCYPEAEAEAERARSLATASNLSFGIGLVGIGVGVMTWLVSPSNGGEASAKKAQQEYWFEVSTGAGASEIQLTHRF